MAISLAVKIWGDINPLLTELKKAEKGLNAFSRKMTKAGKELTTGLTLPIVAMGVYAVKNFAEAENAAASLSAQIRANGKDVDTTMSQYSKFALKMQELTTFEDDAVKGFLQLAESMQAPDAQKATQDAIGLSKAFGIEMPAAIKMAVQAQNGQFTMLNRMNPAIKAAKTQTEKAAIAQKMFADSFKIATEQAKVGLGPLQQLGNQINNLSESFGKIVSGYIIPFVEKLKNIMTWLDGLSEGTKKTIVNVALFAATIGPLLLVMGKIPAVIAAMIGSFTTFVTIMKSVSLALWANPWLALAAAITLVTTALIAYNLAKEPDLSDQQKKDIVIAERRKKDIQDYVNADKKGRETIMSGWEKQATEYFNLWQKAREKNNKADQSHYATQYSVVKEFIDDLKTATTAIAPPGGIKITGDETKKDKGVIADLTEEIGKLEIQLQKEIATNNINAQSTSDLIERKRGLIEYYKKEIEQLRALQKFQPKEAPQISYGGKSPFVGATGPQEGALPPLSTGLPEASKAATTFYQKLTEIQNALSGIGDAAGPVFSSLKNALSGIVNFAQQAANGFKEGFISAFQAVAQVASSIMSAITSIITQNTDTQIAANDNYYTKEKEAIENSYMTQERKTAALEKLDKDYAKKRRELMIQQAKDQKTAAIIQAVIAGALAVVTALASYGPASIIMAVIVGALAAVQIALIASQPLPSFAEGGLAYAPQMAVVGDNPNAAVDPEVISPLSKLKGMMRGAQEVTVYGVLKGSDIYISSERGAVQVQRIRGY